MSEEIELRNRFSPKQIKSKFNQMPRNARFKLLTNLLIILICVFGLIYYSKILIDEYYKGQTVVNVRYETQSFNQKIPSFTICFPEIFSMRRIAKKYPDLNETDLDKLDIDFNENRLGTNRIKITEGDSFKYFNLSSLSLGEIFNLSLPFEDDEISVVKIIVNGLRHFDNDTTMVEDVHLEDPAPIESIVFLGAMKKCFTFFSHLNQTWRDFNLDIKKITIWINLAYLKKQFPMSKYLEKKIKFSMHSPNTFPQLSLNEFAELTNYSSSTEKERFDECYSNELIYNRWKVKLLGPGYDTNCRKYNLDDNQSDNFRSDCINNCIQENLNQCLYDKKTERNVTHEKCYFETNGLWRKSSFNLAQDLKLCGGDDDAYWEMKNCLGSLNSFESQCQKTCRPDCDNRYYYYEIKKSETDELKWDQCLEYEFRTTITHNRFPDQLTEHLPKVDFISFFANFGGLLGMWTGISVLAFFKYVLKIF